MVDGGGGGGGGLGPGDGDGVGAVMQLRPFRSRWSAVYSQIWPGALLLQGSRSSVPAAVALTQPPNADTSCERGEVRGRPIDIGWGGVAAATTGRSRNSKIE